MITFSNAERGDIEEIMAVIAAIITYPDKNLINQWDQFYPTRDIFDDDITNRRLFICRKSGAIAGLFVLMEDKLYEDNANWRYNGPFLVLHRFCVSPPYQGRGIAKEMLRYAEVYAAERHYKTMRLDTFSQNPRSKRLYTGAGYVYAGDIKGRSGIYHCYEKSLHTKSIEQK